MEKRFVRKNLCFQSLICQRFEKISSKDQEKIFFNAHKNFLHIIERDFLKFIINFKNATTWAQNTFFVKDSYLQKCFHPILKKFDK